MASPLNLDLAATSMLNFDARTGASVGSFPPPPNRSASWVPVAIVAGVLLVVGLIWKVSRG